MEEVMLEVPLVRKDAGYQLDQRILVGVLGASDEVISALEHNMAYFKQETLADEVRFEDDGSAWDANAETAAVETSLLLAIRRSQR